MSLFHQQEKEASLFPPLCFIYCHLYGFTWMAVISFPVTHAFTHVPSTSIWVELLPVTVDLWDSEALQLSMQMVGREEFYVLSVMVASHATLPSDLHSASCFYQAVVLDNALSLLPIVRLPVSDSSLEPKQSFILF